MIGIRLIGRFGADYVGAQSGFGYDAENNSLTALDETWRAYC
jgi:hypothetical protein